MLFVYRFAMSVARMLVRDLFRYLFIFVILLLLLNYQGGVDGEILTSFLIKSFDFLKDLALGIFEEMKL